MLHKASYVAGLFLYMDVLMPQGAGQRLFLLVAAGILPSGDTGTSLYLSFAFPPSMAVTPL